MTSRPYLNAQYVNYPPNAHAYLQRPSFTPFCQANTYIADITTLRIWFYTPSASDPWMNKLVVRYDPPFSHVELQFHDDKALTMYMGSRVRFKTRTFNPESYTCMLVPVSMTQYRRLYALAEKLMENPLIQFSRYEAFLALNGMEPSQPYSPDTFEYIEYGETQDPPPFPMQTFCARLIADVMSYVGVIPPTNTAATPSGLATLVQTLNESGLPSVSAASSSTSTFDNSSTCSIDVQDVERKSTAASEAIPVFHTDVFFSRSQ